MAKGFTLVELLIVIAVAGFLAALSLPIYQGYLSSSRQSAMLQVMQSVKIFEEDRRVRLGEYVEGAYDVAPWLGIPSGTELLAWARWEDWDLHREVPRGLAADPSKDARALTVGLELKPHPSVVVKADATFQDNEADADTEDPLLLGIGFVF